MTDLSVIRFARFDDAPELAALLSRNREFLKPWEPVREDSYFTPAGQEAVLDRGLTEQGDGRRLMFVILDETRRIIGQLTVSAIVRGAFQSGSVGYWVEQSRNGAGMATRALAESLQVAFDGWGLHRIQAETLEHNTASQRVLVKNGFERYGFAPRYLNIAGQWQDHVLYQRVNERWRDPVIHLPRGEATTARHGGRSNRG